MSTSSQESLDTDSANERPESFAELVQERLKTAYKAQYALLQVAVNKGVPEDDLPALIANTITNGGSPRVVEGVSMKDGFSSVHLLSGRVPPELLEVRAVHTPEEVVPAIHFPSGVSRPAYTIPAGFAASVTYNELRHKATEFPDFSVETLLIPAYDIGSQ